MVFDLRFLGRAGDSDGGGGERLQLVSTSDDRSVRLWRVDVLKGEGE